MTRARHAHRMSREEHVAVIARSMEREYQRWREAHPKPTALEELAEIYRIGAEELRTPRRKTFGSSGGWTL